MERVARPVIYAVLFFILIAEITLTRYISIGSATPDLLLVYLVFLGLFYGARAGVEAGIVTGLIKDAFAVNFFGINILFFGLVGLISGSVSDKIYKENFVTQIIFCFITSYMISVLNLKHAIYTAAIAPFMILILRYGFSCIERLYAR